MDSTPEPDAYFVGVKARQSGIPRIKNPYNSTRSFIDAMYVDKQREEWNRGWDAEDEFIKGEDRRNYYRR